MLDFKKPSEFSKGTLYNQLIDAYSFNDECKKTWDTSWKKYDDYFYDNLYIADKYCLITVLDGNPIGHISWDPRHRPDYVEIGHNCIITKYKGKGYGHIQLEEAVRRIKEYDDLKKIIVTTNEIFVPAQRNYESVGFKKIKERENKETPFAGKYIDYELAQVRKKGQSNKNQIQYMRGDKNDGIYNESKRESRSCSTDWCRDDNTCL